jgi:hypothetical protein
MDAATRDPARSWEELQIHLAGSFTARIHGFPGTEISLLSPEGEFGRVRRHGSSNTVFTTGPLNATIEHTGHACYRMLVGSQPDGAPALIAEPVNRSADALEIRVEGRIYGARASFLRNRAEVRSPEGEEVVRLEGNLTGRRYAAVFSPETVGALQTAILLLHHLVIHRGLAFRAG